ncbi:GNAT family N-acetyltransferase [Arthrobacter sp. H35-D1]|uniref:GNAT family N-acetyltransferase n=1 Tax=Arthrobacter sp. H35-D1 TaxID=3046202 RepID=UPI0024BB1E99|nr:GNAT family N-acetyltransferase [Arthrobacter sp. H35-D1]MDJ0314979.1 GNAT family N-acetyltransferase [Arthrobacter sp. H35-D1]
MKILLQTPRLVLREFTEADAGLLAALDADPSVMRFISNGVATPLQEITAEHIPAYLAYHRKSPDFGFWVAQSRESNNFLGWFHLRSELGCPETEPELGYRLHRSCWGQGLATEGSRALIDHAFLHTRVTRVTANTMVVHVASRRVMEKSGLVLVRHFIADWPVHIDGDEHGDVQYSITREEWQGCREAV